MSHRGAQFGMTISPRSPWEKLMKKKSNRLRVGALARIKSSKETRRLLWRVYLKDTYMGQEVRIIKLNDDAFGSPPLRCHKVCGVRDPYGLSFWVPPGALVKV